MRRVGKAIKVKRRRVERVWAVLICSALGGCLALLGVFQVGGFQLAVGPGLRASLQSGPAARGPSRASMSEGYTLTDDDQIRTGSILITPSRGDKCQHSLFDNYTGLVWPVGTVSCEAALLKSKEKQPSAPDRLQVIGAAFRSAR